MLKTSILEKTKRVKITHEFFRHAEELKANLIKHWREELKFNPQT
jgi:hypothetical protein